MRRTDLAYLAVAAALVLLPLAASDWQLTQLAQLCCYGLLALSLGLIWGQAGLLCFGQSLFFGLGAYTMSLASLDMLPWPTGLGASWLSLVLACLVPALVAQILGRFLFHGRGLRGAYFGIAMLALSLMAERVATSWDYVGGLNGLVNVPPFTPWAGLELVEPRPVWWSMAAVVLVVMLVLESLARSRAGIVLRAIRDDEDRVALMGYDTAQWKTSVLTLSAMVAGLGGACFVAQFGFVSPAVIGFALSTEVLIWVALGGRGLLLGAFLGAILVRWGESALSEQLGSWWLLAVGVLFVLAVILFPRGLIAEPLLRWAERQPRR